MSTTTATRQDTMTLNDRIHIRRMLSLGMIEAVVVDGVTRYRSTGRPPQITVHRRNA